MTFESFFDVKWVSGNTNSRWGAPNFWYFCKDEPITLPFDQWADNGWYCPIACISVGDYPKVSTAKTPVIQLCVKNTIIQKNPRYAQYIHLVNMLSANNAAVKFNAKAVNNPRMIAPGNQYSCIFYYFTEAFPSLTPNEWSYDDDVEVNYEKLKNTYDWDFFEKHLKENLVGTNNPSYRRTDLTDDEIKEIKNNSFIQYIVPSKIPMFPYVNSTYPVGGNVSYRTGFGQWTDNSGFISPYMSQASFDNPDIFLRIGFVANNKKSMPRQIYYKRNAYANSTNATSVCFNALSIRKSDTMVWENLDLPPCITGMNDPAQATFLAPKKYIIKGTNQISEYIRRDFPGEQEVSTDLNFTGKVKVQEPVEANDVSTKDYVDRVLDKEYFKDLFPGIKYGQLQT